MFCLLYLFGTYSSTWKTCKELKFVIMIQSYRILYWCCCLIIIYGQCVKIYVFLNKCVFLEIMRFLDFQESDKEIS